MTAEKPEGDVALAEAAWSAARDARLSGAPNAAVLDMIAAYRSFYVQPKGCDYDKETADLLESQATRIRTMTEALDRIIG